MRQIVIWMSVILLSSGLATLMLYDNGQVSMVWGVWVLETSLSFLLAIIALGFLLLYLLVRIISNVWRLPTILRRRQQLRKLNKAETSMAKGMVALEYGDWQKAEKELIKSAKYSEAGLVHYLSAAKMAHNQQAYDRRDSYIKQAKHNYPLDYVTIGLVEARLLSEQQPEMASAILESLYAEEPKNRTVLAEYAQALRALQRWDELTELLPALRKQSAMDRAQIGTLETEMLAGQLRQAGDQQALNRLWQQLNGKQQRQPELLAEYVEQCIGWGNETGLATLIEKALRKQWDDRLVYQYGRLREGLDMQRLQLAEKWLKGQEQNPVLLLSLGRLAYHNQLWGRGQSYLKSSLALRPEIETFHALAQCYEAEGEEKQAALIYKEAILQLEDQSLSR